MPVQKNCEQCHKNYEVPPSMAARSRFCCMACRNSHDRTAERRTLTCEACGDSFNSPADHGKWPRFCSRTCYFADKKRPETRECATCGSAFLSTGSSHQTADGFRLYCSKKCQADSLKLGEECACLNCGGQFWKSPSQMTQHSGGGCCSAACAHAFYKGARNANFKGGQYLHKQQGERHVRLDRPGYVGKYIGEHRVVASRAIGRLVTRQEYVLRINRNPTDNRAENLFICASVSEFSRRRNGSLPWPTESNLAQYNGGKEQAP